jgi:predicted RNA-binding Zn ribbon-like protein
MREVEHHRLIGGALCLDFANTLVGHGAVPRHEYLKDYRDLVLWSRHAHVLTSAEANSLVRESLRHPSKSIAVFRKALILREMIYRIFSALAHHAHPGQADLNHLNASRLENLSHSTIAQERKRFRLIWKDPTALDRILWPIVLSATELLTSTEFSHIKQCAGEGCDWLFLDTSRNHLRRWCTMDECGNRAKMRRRYARVRNRPFR